MGTFMQGFRVSVHTYQKIDGLLTYQSQSMHVILHFIHEGTCRLVVNVTFTLPQYLYKKVWRN